MKICQPHWDELREAIKAKGLGHLIAVDGEALAGRIQKELDGEKTIYDPLFSANMAIWNNALEQGGIYLMGTDENGNHYCPLCEMNKHGWDHKVWLEHASEEQRKKAEANGLLGN